MVQPVGLTALSYNWVILHIDMDQIEVQIQIHPIGIGLNNKNLSKTNVFSKKNNLLLSKHGNFTPNFKSFQCFNKTLNQISHLKR